MNGLLGPVTANRNMLAQAVNARNKPEFQMKPNTPQGLLDAAALAMSPVPVAGDVVGLLADGHRFATQPETRTPLNFGLAALGLIPFLPPLVNMGLSQAAKARGLPSVDLPRGPGRNQAGAIVYHGSPHKFDAFDSSKIGTGEGAQAYGHGLYFAENPAVAKSYQETLTDRGGSSFHKTSTSYKVGDKEIFKDSPDYAAAAVASDMKTWGIDPKSKDGKDWLNNEVAARYMGGQTNSHSELKKKALQFLKSGITEETSRGALYKVDLPDEAIAKMLDWDKPLSQQAPEVRKAISKTGLLGDPSSILSQRERVFADFDAGRITKLERDSALEKIGSAVSLEKQGNALYTALGNQAEASRKLRELGVPGIKYLDGFSRGPQGGSGTSNYVVFPGNEGLLKILERQ